MNDSASGKNQVPLLKKILTKIRYGLTFQFMRYLLLKIGIDLSPYYLFQEGISYTGMPELKGMDGDYSCELLNAEDMKKIGALNYMGFTCEKLLVLLESGEKCIGIRHNGEIPAFMWINFKELKYKSTLMHLGSDEAYLWFMYTMESYRGKNLAPFLRYKSYELLKEMGVNKLYSISDYFNSPAVKFKSKLNAKRLKLILYVELFNKYRRSVTVRAYYS